MQHLSLGKFARWVLDQPIGQLRPPRDALRAYDDGQISVVSMALFRHPPYQAELITFLPSPDGGIVPDHGHPNIDSIEVILSGEVGFTLRGKRLLTDEMLAKRLEDGAAWVLGAKIRVRPGETHGAVVGPAGGTFLSIQHWLNGVPPTSVGLDWDGPRHVQVVGGK